MYREQLLADYGVGEDGGPPVPLRAGGHPHHQHDQPPAAPRVDEDVPAAPGPTPGGTPGPAPRAVPGRTPGGTPGQPRTTTAAGAGVALPIRQVQVAAIEVAPEGPEWAGLREFQAAEQAEARASIEGRKVVDPAQGDA